MKYIVCFSFLLIFGCSWASNLEDSLPSKIQLKLNGLYMPWRNMQFLAFGVGLEHKLKRPKMSLSFSYYHTYINDFKDQNYAKRFSSLTGGVNFDFLKKHDFIIGFKTDSRGLIDYIPVIINPEETGDRTFYEKYKINLTQAFVYSPFLLTNGNKGGYVKFDANSVNYVGEK